MLPRSQHRGRRTVSNVTAVLLLLAAVCLSLLLPTAVTEWRAPGTFAESIGLADAEVQPTDQMPKLMTVQRDIALAQLATLPGGSEIQVYAKHSVAGPCGPGAVACAPLGGNTIWISAGAPAVPLVTHEYMHTRTNLVEQAWLTLNPGLWGNATVPFAVVPGLEGSPIVGCSCSSTTGQASPCCPMSTATALRLSCA